MSEKQTFKLVHATARARAAGAVKQAPDGYVVTVGPPSRSGDQNAMLHAWLSEIAATIEWAGAMRDVETWKRLLVASWLRARGESIEILPALDGFGVDVVFRRTSEMNRNEFSELCEYVIAWATEKGMTHHDDNP